MDLPTALGRRGNPPDRRKRKRVGRGRSSGHGKTCGRGHNGQKARSGYHSRALFEGGQMPLFRRLPKRGFRHPYGVEYSIVNLGDLAAFPAGAVVDMEEMKKKGLLRTSAPVKVLGSGELPHPITVRANAFSESARKKIQASGGSAEEIPC